MRVAVDAMGGDFAPEEVVKGAVQAATAGLAEILLVGREPAILAELNKYRTNDLPISVVHANDVVGMDESPASAIRVKRDSSVVVGAQLVKNGRADAFVSAGNSGAVMAASLLTLGRIKGIERPALGVLIPGVNSSWLLIDAGANVDCKPLYLQQFGLMGSVYMQCALGIARPKVALLSNGEEDSKGTQIVVDAHRLLREAGLNFVGNIEGRDLALGNVDVVVTDGFVGNIVLKFGEGAAEGLFQMVRKELEQSLIARLVAFALLPAVRRLKMRVDFSEYGGALLLGVDGVCIIAHGRSKAKAIRNSVLRAKLTTEQGMIGAIKDGVEAIATTQPAKTTLLREPIA